MESKILIADDESDIVSMLGSFFESKGFRVLPAFNGAFEQSSIVLIPMHFPPPGVSIPPSALSLLYNPVTCNHKPFILKIDKFTDFYFITSSTKLQ